MAILNGSYKFHTSPTNYQDSSFSYQVNYTDNAGTEYKEISFSPGFFTAGRKLNDSSRVTFFDTVQPINDDLYDLFTFDDIDACPWIILTFNNQQVDNLLYEIITNCAAPYLDGILIKITSPNGITLATEKTIVNSNIKVTIDESLLNQGADTSDATAVASEILSGKTAYLADGKATGTMLNNGAISSTMDGINTKSVVIPAGYTSGGSVGLDNTIDNEVDEQTDLIAQIRSAVDSLPEAGSGENVIETCTVNIRNENSLYIIYTALGDNGIAFTTNIQYDVNMSINSFNVVCGSNIYIPTVYPYHAYDITGNAQFIEEFKVGPYAWYLVFYVAATAGEIIEISVYNDD